MTWQVVWTNRALRDLRRLDPGVRDGVIAAMVHYAETERGDVKRLVLPLYGYRLRYRHWRVSFERDDDGCTLTVEWVKHRREAYRGE
jgi:mRNA-degrading endonuclease RelE of RelBE toxin-antitoxin system